MTHSAAALPCVPTFWQVDNELTVKCVQRLSSRYTVPRELELWAYTHVLRKVVDKQERELCIATCMYTVKPPYRGHVGTRFCPFKRLQMYCRYARTSIWDHKSVL